MRHRTLWGVIAAGLFFGIAGFFPTWAAPPAPGTAFVSVTLNGVRLGEDFTSAFESLFPTIVFDSTTGLFNLWVFDGSGFKLSLAAGLLLGGWAVLRRGSFSGN